MFNFILSSNSFNKFQRRLSSLISQDKDAVISFILSDKLEVYYRSKVDNADSPVLFHEELELTNSTGNGSASLSVSSLLTLKVPEFTSEEKFPYCKFVNFKFSDALLSIEFTVNWNRYSGENDNKLKFGLLEEAFSIEVYDKLFSNKFKEEVEVEIGYLVEAITNTAFIKADVTSRSSNGVLIYSRDDSLYFVSTDSNTAVRYEGKFLTKPATDLFVVISSSVLNILRQFLVDSTTVKVGLNKSNLLFKVPGRVVLLPVMQGNYVIDDPDSFFSIPDEKIAAMDLKPFLMISSNLLNNTTDIYKRLIMSTENNAFSIRTAKDATENLPAEIAKPQTINVNGSFFSSCCQRLVNMDPVGDLYFDSHTDRITLTSQDRRLIFLIQGLSN